MKLHVPLKSTPSDLSDIKRERKLTIERVVPGPYKGKNQLGLAVIAEISFNSKFQAVKIQSRNNFFLRVEELQMISSFVEQVVKELGKSKKVKGE